MKKVLIVTYYWPPAGGPGVQRILKFAKYLPQFGWQPLILTVENGEYPAYDKSLEDDIPEQCKIYRTKALEPFNLYKKFTGMAAGESIPVATLADKKVSWKKRLAQWIRLNFFIPDAKIGWKGYAVKEGKKIIREEKPDLIFSTSPPPTVHLIARKLANWSGVKWIADFRDPWTKIHYYTAKPNFISRYLDRKLEKEVIASCSAAVCASYAFIDLLTSDHNDKFTTITNGYDKELMISDKKDNKKIQIVYTGGITANRYYGMFFAALSDLIAEDQDLAEKLEIVIAGKIEPDIEADLKQLFSDKEQFQIVGYLPHQEAMQLMKEADILLIFLEQKEHYEGHIPAKLFEYLTTGNYVLGIGSEEGDTADILRKTGSGKVFSGNTDFKSIIKELNSESLLERRESINWDEIKGYSRKVLTRELTDLFEGLCQ